MSDAAVFKDYITHFILLEKLAKVGVVKSGSIGGHKSVVDSFGK